MKETHEFLMPDYYPSFACKMGACRSACCVGWPISFTVDDYFRLLGVECSPELRRKIDGAMHMARRPTPQEYAQISPRYDGQCPMRLEDGRCALHAELGEDVLAAVCRLYPRGIRSDGVYECSCANSCEAVLEMLLEREPPIAFVRRTMTIDMPPAAPRTHSFETMGRVQEICLWLISFVQNRAYPLPQRLLMLGGALEAVDQALSAHDEARLLRLLHGQERTPVPQPIEAGHEQMLFGLQAVGRMLDMLDEHSDSIRDYGNAALAYFGRGETAYARYVEARQRFEALTPKWENWFEHMLVNHMFFAQFPYQDRPVPFKEEFLALCAVYVLLRFLCIGRAAEHTDTDAIVDAAAAAFRLIDHTAFDRYAGAILERLGCEDWAHQRELLCL